METETVKGADRVKLAKTGSECITILGNEFVDDFRKPEALRKELTGRW